MVDGIFFHDNNKLFSSNKSIHSQGVMRRKGYTLGGV